MSGLMRPPSGRPAWQRVWTAVASTVVLVAATSGCSDDDAADEGETASSVTTSESSDARDEGQRQRRRKRPAAVNCDNADPELVSSIDGGLTAVGGGRLDNAFVVPLPDSTFETVFAARIRGDGMGRNTVGTWATGQESLTIAVNEIAQEFSVWGEAAKPGSPVDEERKLVALSVAAEKAERCVRQAIRGS